MKGSTARGGILLIHCRPVILHGLGVFHPVNQRLLSTYCKLIARLCVRYYREQHDENKLCVSKVYKVHLGCQEKGQSRSMLGAILDKVVGE